MEQHSGNEQDPGRGYVTDVYHFEKYVVPGAYAVAMLFLLPRYLLADTAIGSIDLGTAVIFALVVGHLIESLKVYQWGRLVREDFQQFNSRVDGWLIANGVDGKKAKECRERAKTVLFTLLPRGESSEFAWNLVRWQKMCVIAIVSVMATFEWFAFGVFNIAEQHGCNPFRNKFRIELLNSNLALSNSAWVEFGIAALMLLSSHFIYRFGLDRQQRNNESYFQLILRHKDSILRSIKDEASQPGTKS